MSKFVTTVTTVIALALPAFATAAPVNLIQNGSFEDVSSASGIQTQAAGTWSIYSAIPGWTSTGSGIEVRNNVAGTAFDGVDFVELDARSNSIMLQSISTLAGQLYTLSFYYSPRPNVVTPANTNDITVYWNGAALGTQGGSGTGVHTWRRFEYAVVGTGSDSVRFAATGASDSYGGSLDMVSLQVPEPGSAPLVLAGFAAAVLARRRAARA
jgi:PEP-CTERM motif